MKQIQEDQELKEIKTKKSATGYPSMPNTPIANPQPSGLPQHQTTNHCPISMSTGENY